ncbi:hypothetical protein SAY86_015845 [Trapa natans]|uniref:UspA domain-containing protein n=1 Tax=Trapa natans TaxID=22666 RepID=A0AAN7R0Q6_TRANT|nr:hypothetical protein SAY86_015845 [Trapa natans]
MGRSLIQVPIIGIGLRSTPPRVNHISFRLEGQEAAAVGFPRGDEADDGGPAAAGNRVMVVVDSSLDAKGALEWTLSHAVQTRRDCIVLLQVVKHASKEHGGKFRLSAHEAADSILRSMCKSRRPLVKVEVAMAEGKEKGPAIVEEAKRQKVSMLVLGQRRQTSLWRLMRRWWARKGRRRLGTVEYCIQNASCLAVAVRRKGRKLGGYLITTKRHKNFWLLA